LAIKRLTPLQAIKRYCRYDCCANDLRSYKECSNTKCPLHAHKNGKRQKTLPFSKYTQKTGVTPIKSSTDAIVGGVSE